MKRHNDIKKKCGKSIETPLICLDKHFPKLFMLEKDASFVSTGSASNHWSHSSVEALSSQEGFTLTVSCTNSLKLSELSSHTTEEPAQQKTVPYFFFFLILFFLSGAGVALSKLKCWSQVSGINTNVKWLQTSGWRDISMIARLASDSESLVKSHLSCSAPEWPWTSSELQVPSNYKVTDFSWLPLSVLSSLWPVCFFSTESTAYYL